MVVLSWSKPQDVYKSLKLLKPLTQNHSKHVQYTQTDTIRQKNTITLFKKYFFCPADMNFVRKRCYSLVMIARTLCSNLNL